MSIDHRNIEDILNLSQELQHKVIESLLNNRDSFIDTAKGVKKFSPKKSIIRKTITSLVTERLPQIGKRKLEKEVTSSSSSKRSCREVEPFSFGFFKPFNSQIVALKSSIPENQRVAINEMICDVRTWEKLTKN